MYRYIDLLRHVPTTAVLVGRIKLTVSYYNGQTHHLSRYGQTHRQVTPSSSSQNCVCFLSLRGCMNSGPSGIVVWGCGLLHSNQKKWIHCPMTLLVPMNHHRETVQQVQHLVKTNHCLDPLVATTTATTTAMDDVDHPKRTGPNHPRNRFLWKPKPATTTTTTRISIARNHPKDPNHPNPNQRNHQRT